MPGFAPRNEPTKKREQLASRKLELQLALQTNCTREKLHKLVEKYRHGQLSFLKAKLHVLKEKNFEKKSTSLNYAKLEAAIAIWEKKLPGEIISELNLKGNIFFQDGNN
jgi:hypothetical protein